MNFNDPNELIRQIEQAKRTQELIDSAGGLDNLRRNIEHSRKMVNERNLNNLYRNQSTSIGFFDSNFPFLLLGMADIAFFSHKIAVISFNWLKVSKG